MSPVHTLHDALPPADAHHPAPAAGSGPQAARQRETTEAFQAEYDRRAEIEGTISWRGTRSTRLRRTHHIGLARVHLGHILTAVGRNVLRLGEWWLETTRAQTRLSPFARLNASSVWRSRPS
jgi:hypothetical protein